MSDFNKNEYNKMYTLNKRKSLNFNLDNKEYDSLVAFCQKINVKPAFYLKALVNADLIQRGFDPLFVDGRTHKVVLLSTDSPKDIDG